MISEVSKMLTMQNWHMKLHFTTFRPFNEYRNIKVMLLRHAQSEYNEICDIEQKRLGLENRLEWQVPLLHDEYCEKGPYHPGMMDSRLSNTGKQQCRELQRKIKNKPIDMILVSPMLRTLQTCNYVFASTNIPVKVLPILSESYRYSCDIVPFGTTAQKRRLFPSFDFCRDYEPTLCYNLSEEHKQRLNQHYKDKCITDHKEKELEFIKLMRKHSCIETERQLRQRLGAIRKQVGHIVKQYSLKHICIVSHYHVLTALTARRLAEDEGPALEYVPMRNCEPREMDLKKLMVEMGQ